MEIRVVFLPEQIFDLSNEAFEQCLKRINNSSELARIRRFYHREDAWRSVIGLLLPRHALLDHGFSPENVHIARTSSGKPYLADPTGMDYNVSHDNQMIAMVSSVTNGSSNPSCIGIDVMRRKLPQGETIRSFLRGIESTLSRSELDMFTPQLDRSTAEKYIFLLWTLKEAYSKALGLGLGFDFRRIEYHIPDGTIRIDGKIPEGWHFIMFEATPPGSPDIYQGAIARLGNDNEPFSLVYTDNVVEDPMFRFIPITEISNGESKGI